MSVQLHCLKRNGVGVVETAKYLAGYSGFFSQGIGLDTYFPAPQYSLSCETNEDRFRLGKLCVLLPSAVWLALFLALYVMRPRLQAVGSSCSPTVANISFMLLSLGLVSGYAATGASSRNRATLAWQFRPPRSCACSCRTAPSRTRITASVQTI